MNSINIGDGDGIHGETCVEFPELRRLNYFFGQMLSVQDFQTEQAFFREKLKLHNRCLHGYGVVCGLLVEPLPIPKECDAKELEEERKLWEELEKLLAQKAASPPPAVPTASAKPPVLSAPGAEAHSAAASTTAQGPPAVSTATANQAPAAPPASPPADLDAQIETLRRRLADFYKLKCREEPHTCVRICCGLALDCHGNELVVRRPLLVDLVQWLSPADYQRVKQGAHELYVSICFCEQGADPVRPVLSGTCGATPECTYGKWQEGVRVAVTVDPPAVDARCETCCEACADCCLLLARIDCFFPGHELRSDHIHNEVRRRLSVYPPTTITGINWRHGHHYTPYEASELLGTGNGDDVRSKGLEIRFSRPVLASTIRPGVMDMWVVEGGTRGGRSGNIYHKAGEFVDKPHEGLVDHIFYRDRTMDTLEPGDRLLIILRADFILDKCCQSVDGENTGGRVPFIKEYAEKLGLYPRHEECNIPPLGYAPWRSGNGKPGGTFESWFFIREREHERESERRHGGAR